MKEIQECSVIVSRKFLEYLAWALLHFLYMTFHYHQCKLREYKFIYC